MRKTKFFIPIKYLNLLWSVLLVHCIHTGTKNYLPTNIEYLFHEVHAKGFEGMMKLINPWLQKSTQLRKEEFAIGSSVEVEYSIRRAFTIALSRINHDGVVMRLLQHIQSRTSTKADFYDIVFIISQQAVKGLRNPKRSPTERATYYTILENINEALTPYISTYPRAREVLTLIAKSRLKVPESIHNVRYLHALENKTFSPSAVAQFLLRKNPPQEEKK